MGRRISLGANSATKFVYDGLNPVQEQNDTTQYNSVQKCGARLTPDRLPASTSGEKRPARSPSSETAVRLVAAQSDAVDGERKTVTALFADIKGSTELMEDLDPERAQNRRPPRSS